MTEDVARAGVVWDRHSVVQGEGGEVSGDGAEAGSSDASANPAVRWWQRTPARIGMVIAGAAFGLFVAATSDNRDAPQWIVWASLAVALTAASGTVFGYGLAQWPAVAEPGQVRFRQVLPALGTLAVVSVGMLAVGTILTVVNGDPDNRAGIDPVGLSLTTLAVVGAVPVAADLAAVRERARRLSESPGQWAEEILALRLLMSGFLHAGGALVALATVALGAAVRSDGERVDTLVVVVFGANMSVLLALAYAPAAAAVRASGRQLATAVVPLTGATAADLPDQMDARTRLEQALGVDRGLLADLQSDLIILAPLLAAGAAAFLQR